MDIHEFVNTATQALGHTNILNESGAVLYSAWNTLIHRETPEGKIYLLGSNPGGNPDLDNLKKQTIIAHLQQLPTQKLNEYTDGQWVSGKPGCHRMQIHVKNLIKALGFDIKEICASNLVFKRTRDLKAMGKKEYYNLADKCREVHELILEGLKPRVILAFGVGEKSAYGYLEKCFAETKSEEYPSGYGNWTCRACAAQINGLSFLVVGVPHLSYYNINGRTDTIRWLSEKINKT